MRAFLMYIDDWLSSKRIATMDAPEERGYLRLLLHAATEDDCGLPDDDSLLAIYSMLGPQWFRCTADESKRLGDKTSGQKLRECFEVVNGRLYNTRLLREFIHQKEVQAKRSVAGKRGGQAKANAKQMLQQMNSNCLPVVVASGQQTDKQNPTNDVCVSVSTTSTDTSLSEKKDVAVKTSDSWDVGFDYNAGFMEVWGAYPKKGQTYFEDSKRMYYEAINADPDRVHSQIMDGIRGKWAKSDLWARGFVTKLSEFLRARRWLESPEPHDPSASNGKPNGKPEDRGTQMLKRLAAGEDPATVYAEFGVRQ